MPVLTDIILTTEKEIQYRKWVDVGLSFAISTSFETLDQSECLSLADRRMYKYKQHKKIVMVN